MFQLLLQNWNRNLSCFEAHPCKQWLLDMCHCDCCSKLWQLRCCPPRCSGAGVEAAGRKGSGDSCVDCSKGGTSQPPTRGGARRNRVHPRHLLITTYRKWINGLMTDHSIPDLDQWFSDWSQYLWFESMVQWAFQTWINGSVTHNIISNLDQWLSDSLQHIKRKSMAQ